MSNHKHTVTNGPWVNMHNAPFVNEEEEECATCGKVISEDSFHVCPPEEDEDIMPPWTCGWCKNSQPDSEQPHQTFDGNIICDDCFRRDDDGPQIAKYGIDEYNKDNEGVRVVDVDGKVDYE